MSEDRVPGFATLAIHAGAKPDPTTGARVTPIYQTTSFVFNDVEHAASLFGLQAFGNIYTRINNPTQAVLEERIAALEGGTAALAVASGHAAQVVAFHTLLSPGDEFIAAQAALRRLDQPVQPLVQELRLAGEVGRHRRHLDRSRRRSRRRPRRSSSSRSPTRAASSPTSPASPTSPSGQGCRSSSTTRWRRPTSSSPFEHGADIVVHSLTKFLGGHGNSIGGIIVDGGKFNWTANKRYPLLSEPRPEYNGMVIGETFRQFRLRHRLPRARACAISGRRSRRSTRSSS